MIGLGVLRTRAPHVPLPPNAIVESWPRIEHPAHPSLMKTRLTDRDDPALWRLLTLPTPKRVHGAAGRRIS